MTRKTRAVGICAMALALLPVTTGVVSAQADSRPPIIFWHSDPVRPDETVMLIGARLGGARAIHVARLTDGPAGKATGSMPAFPPTASAVRPIQASDGCVKFVVPNRFERGLYVVQVETRAGRSAVRLVNRPDIWWVQGDGGLRGVPGGWLRVFGKSLCGARAGKATVRLEGPHDVMLEGTGDEYQLKVALPDNLPEGEYRARVHNGWGGPFGWSVPVKVNVERRKPWPDRVFNVLEFGAERTGQKDSTAAINSALKAARKNGGGIVYFPRGRYQITTGLTIPRFTVLKGEKRELVNLYWPDFDKPPSVLLHGTDSFGLQELTLYAHKHEQIISNGTLSRPGAGDVFLRRVRIRANIYYGHLGGGGYGDPKGKWTPEEAFKRFKELHRLSPNEGYAVTLGGRNIEITHCDFYVSGAVFHLAQARGANLSHNVFYVGRWADYRISNSEQVIFENNDVVGSDLMSWGGGMFASRNVKNAANQNQYWGHNRFRLFHFGDREALGSDGPGGGYYGPIVATANGFTLPADGKWHAEYIVGMTCFVVDGRGAGQWRIIVARDGNSVRLDRPWKVVPDKTTRVAVVMTQRHYLIVGNAFSDVGSAVQFYGTALDCIVAGNRCARGGGFRSIGKQYGDYHVQPPEKVASYQPEWFVQFLGNQITEGNNYRYGSGNAVLSGDSTMDIFGWPPTQNWPWPLNLGAVVRRNHLHNNARIRIGGSTYPSAAVAECVVEHNRIENAEVGIQIDRDTSGILVRKNFFNNVEHELMDSSRPADGRK